MITIDPLQQFDIMLIWRVTVSWMQMDSCWWTVWQVSLPRVSTGGPFSVTV